MITVTALFPGDSQTDQSQAGYAGSQNPCSPVLSPVLGASAMGASSSGRSMTGSSVDQLVPLEKPLSVKV